MDDLNNLTIEQLVQYRDDLVLKRQELLDRMAEERRLKPTFELDNIGVPIQKGESGKEMMDKAQAGGPTLEEYNKTIDAVNNEISRKTPVAQASLNSLGPLWVHRDGTKRVRWYD